MGKKKTPTIDTILNRIVYRPTEINILNDTKCLQHPTDFVLWADSFNAAISRYVHPCIVDYIEHKKWPKYVSDELRFGNSDISTEKLQSIFEEKIDSWYYKLAQKTIVFKPVLKALEKAPPEAQVPQNVSVMVSVVISKYIWGKTLHAPKSTWIVRENNTDPGVFKIESTHGQFHMSYSVPFMQQFLDSDPNVAAHQTRVFSSILQNNHGMSASLNGSTTTHGSPIQINYGMRIPMPYIEGVKGSQTIDCLVTVPRIVIEQEMANMKFPTEPPPPSYIEAMARSKMDNPAVEVVFNNVIPGLAVASNLQQPPQQQGSRAPVNNGPNRDHILAGPEELYRNAMGLHDPARYDRENPPGAAYRPLGAEAIYSSPYTQSLMQAAQQLAQGPRAIDPATIQHLQQAQLHFQQTQGPPSYSSSSSSPNWPFGSEDALRNRGQPPPLPPKIPERTPKIPNNVDPNHDQTQYKYAKDDYVTLEIQLYNFSSFNDGKSKTKGNGTSFAPKPKSGSDFFRSLKNVINQTRAPESPEEKLRRIQRRIERINRIESSSSDGGWGGDGGGDGGGGGGGDGGGGGGGD